jgi:hypothetical protein
MLGMRTVLGAAYNMDRATRGSYRFDKKQDRYLPVYHGYSWWKQRHPDWIEYQCDRKTPAYEYEDTAVVPLDIANPHVLYYMFTHYAQKSAHDGFPLIFFDNVSNHRPERCGHFTKSGKWVQQYSGASNDSSYARDALAWAKYMYRHLKRYSPKTLLAFNLSINPGRPSDYTRFVPYMDVDWDEAGFSRWGTERITDSVWQQEVDAIRYSQKHGKAVWLNYYTLAKSYADLSRDEINWALANYLLVKGSHTYVNINDADSGFFHDLTEYHAPIGRPMADMYQSQGVYMREYSNGVVLVNPSSSETFTVRLATAYSDLYGNKVDTYSLAPASGIVLLKAES